MKFTKEDFDFEALHQGKLMDYMGYQIKWSTTKDYGFIKFVKPNVSMENEIRFNIKTGRQILCNDSDATIDKNILDVVYNILKSITVKNTGSVLNLLDSAIISINNAHINDLKWEHIDGIKFNKFIVSPNKKKGE